MFPCESVLAPGLSTPQLATPPPSSPFPSPPSLYNPGIFREVGSGHAPTPPTRPSAPLTAWLLQPTPHTRGHRPPGPRLSSPGESGLCPRHSAVQTGPGDAWCARCWLAGGLYRTQSPGGLAELLAFPLLDHHLHAHRFPLIYSSLLLPSISSSGSPALLTPLGRRTS